MPKPRKVPEHQGKTPGVGYKKPPAAHQFKPGRSPNPGGRPGGRSLTAILRDVLESASLDTATGTNAERVAAALVRACLGGDTKAIKDVFDRVEGKVPERVTHDVSERAEKTRAFLRDEPEAPGEG